MSERERLEADLRKAQQRLQHVIVSSPAVLFTLSFTDDRIEGISWVSENLERILGYSREAALGREWFLSNIHPQDRDRVVGELRQLRLRGRVALEYRIKHADGNYRWTRCDLRVVRDETAESVEAGGALLDITEQKQAEQREAKLREQFQQAQRMESVGRLAGGVAHDFNNLLTVINGYSDLVLKELAPGTPLHTSVSEIRMAGERATALSKQLLVVSRRQVVQPIELNLNDLIAKLERMLSRIIGEDIRLKSALNPSLGRILADPGLLHQALMNLAVNARDAMPHGGALFIETDNVEQGETYSHLGTEIKPGAYVRLRVSDTGIGMTQEVKSRLFEPFFTTKQPGEGTGLGLATVYGIVKQSGGAISVYSEPGQGTTFTIYLPRLEQWTAPLPEAANPPMLRGTETILIAEDNEQLRKMAALVLRECGYTVLEAADPQEALLLSERHADTIHLLLTDVVMPGSTGRELAKGIKAARPSIEVIFMSGYSGPSVSDRGLLDPAAAYLQKPFSPDGLAAKVREVLGLPSPKGVILVVDDEPGVRHTLRKFLTGVGYEVFEAANGIEAVEQLRLSAVDLVLLDLVMPEREGLETLGILRKEHPELKVIAMSGQFPDLLHAAELLGAVASLPKPIRPAELLELVRGTLGDETP